ncbi:MAG: transglycosylase SLT domain-containing protein [Proteobacteria bacterium]|nr:transglycosylase SLT domain-containing protein [Pseudomonadota bacterium]
MRSRSSLMLVCAAWLAFLQSESVQAWAGHPLCALNPDVRDSLVGPPVDCGPRSSFASVPWTHPITMAEGRRALLHARELIDAGRLPDGILQLRVVEHAVPVIADRVALMQADVFMALQRFEQALKQYERAAASMDRAVAAKARVGRVRALLATDRLGAETALTQLLDTYPGLPERLVLLWEQAQHRQRRGRLSGAGALYRHIDEHFPWTEVAVQARHKLKELRKRRVWVRRFSPQELTRRARRLVRMGSAKQGQHAVDKLLDHPSAQVRAEGHLLRARIARVQGRWEDVRAAAQRARTLGADAAAVGRLLRPAGSPVAQRIDENQAARDARARIHAIRGNKAYHRLSNFQLRRALPLAVEGRLASTADRLLDAMQRRSTLPARYRFDAAMSAIGVASDERVAGLLRTLFDVRRYAVAARYHYGRAMERLGRFGEAEAEYFRVREYDESATRYYALWAEQRLWALENRRSMACTPDLKWGEDAPAPADGDAAEPQELVDADSPVYTRQATAGDTEFIMQQLSRHLDRDRPRGQAGRLSPDVPSEEASVAPADTQRLIELMKPVVEAHAEGYPWLVRALQLVELDEHEAAADELNEVYLAWREARGAPRLRSGLDALYRGEAPPPRAADKAIRKLRADLAPAARASLSKAAQLLGDPGVSARFAGWGRVVERPRAYAERVETAARKYDLDPNLLFAVMRVESIYNRRIVSTAGAVGLMQIMPRTGRLIAERLGRENFKTTDLLDPDTNLEFAAWYLASLLTRFDSSLPLAVAAYNGGPHNVRTWLREHGDRMPLDVFLEHIPFSQTHRYVRRVLTHYAAYRAQQGLPMTPIETQLPPLQPDTVVSF